MRLADEVVDHVVEEPGLLRSCSASRSRAGALKYVFSSPAANVGLTSGVADEPDRVVQVDHLDRRALAGLGVDEARAEADDLAVDVRALLLEVDVDQVLARLDLHRAELVLQDLRAGGRRGVAHGDVQVRRDGKADAWASALNSRAMRLAWAGAQATAHSTSTDIDTLASRATDDSMVGLSSGGTCTGRC